MHCAGTSPSPQNPPGVPTADAGLSIGYAADSSPASNRAFCLDLEFPWVGIFVREKAGAVAVEYILPGLQTHIQQ